MPLYAVTEDLARLAVEEARLMEVIRLTPGTMEAKHQALRASGVYAAHTGIHAEYVRLATGEHSNVEALKRALFLQWYAAIELAVFTGISDVGEVDATHVLREVERRAVEGDLDEEALALLGLFYDVQDWYFDYREDLPSLRRLLSTLPRRAWEALEPDSLRDRGQFSDYLLSMLETAQRTRSGTR